ncbi:AT-hook motif nuclear-localized protein 13 [Linum perenne]
MDSKPPQHLLHPSHHDLNNHYHHQQNHHHHHHHQANMMLGPAPPYHTMINPNVPPSAAGGGGFPFNSMPMRPQSKPPTTSDVGGMNAGSFDGSSPTSSGMRFSIEPAKKKRGRPRKYAPEGNIALGLSPTTPISSSVGHGGDSGAGGGGSGAPAALSSSDNTGKKHRGRPPGSVKRQLDALGGVGGVGFTPHVIFVKAGEVCSCFCSSSINLLSTRAGKVFVLASFACLLALGVDIASKIYSFSQQGPRTVCILSANGAICNVTLRQPASGGTITYEVFFIHTIIVSPVTNCPVLLLQIDKYAWIKYMQGTVQRDKTVLVRRCLNVKRTISCAVILMGSYEIISLTGSVWLSENDGNRSRNGGLSVSLAGSDGRVLGGGVAGMLVAASPVQVIVGSFVAEGRKPTPEESESGPSLPPATHMLNFGAAPMSAASPPFQGASSESSDDHGSSPLNNKGAGIYGNAGQQPLHNMQMYQVLAGQNPQ